MKFKDLKKGMFVYDRWWPWRGGRVISKLKTRVKIHFSQGCAPYTWSYDKAHCQFLEREK